VFLVFLCVCFYKGGEDHQKQFWKDVRILVWGHLFYLSFVTSTVNSTSGSFPVFFSGDFKIDSYIVSEERALQRSWCLQVNSLMDSSQCPPGCFKFLLSAS